MKTTSLFLSILLILGSCSAPSKQELIQGEWTLSSWIDSRNNSDLLKQDDAPTFSIRFGTDTLYILTSHEEEKDNYTFSWSIDDDSLKVDFLGSFKILELSDETCILNTKTKSIFSTEKNAHLETLTLIKE